VVIPSKLVRTIQQSHRQGAGNSKESTAQLQLTDTVFFFGGLVHHLII